MILISGQIEALSTRKDKTIKIIFGSQELSPNEFTELFKLNQAFCYVGIKEEPFIKDEVSLLDNLRTDLDNLKTPSQRLRGILFRNFEQDNKGYKDFNSYYIAEMELISNHYKSKLDAI